MEDRRWQSGSACKRVEIGRVDLAVLPLAKAPPVGLCKRTTADAMDGVPRISQCLDQVPTDEPAGAGDPHGHCALWPTNEYRRPGRLSKRPATDSNDRKMRSDPSATRHNGPTGSFRESLSTTALRRLSMV